MPFNRPISKTQQRSKFTSSLASLAEAEKMIQISVLLPSSAFVGWLLGAGLDKLFHQTWITLVGILFGGISGIVYVVRMVITAGAKPGRGAGANSDNSGPEAGQGK
jgi:F0F1-type ATP synthase assembly protein I